MLNGQAPEFPDLFPEPPFNSLSIRETQLAILCYKAFKDNLKYYIEEATFIYEEEEPEDPIEWRGNICTARSLLRSVRENINLLNERIAILTRRYGRLSTRSPWELLPLGQPNRQNRIQNSNINLRLTRNVSQNTRPSVTVRRNQRRSTNYNRQSDNIQQSPIFVPPMVGGTRQPNPQPQQNQQEINFIDLTTTITSVFSNDETRVFLSYEDQFVMLEILTDGEFFSCMICGENRNTISDNNNNRITSLPCTHKSCLNCLLKWIDTCFSRRSNATCPLCRDIIFNI